MQRRWLAGAMGAAVIALMSPLSVPALLSGSAQAQTALTPAQRALVARMNSSSLSQAQRETLAVQLMALGPAVLAAISNANVGALNAAAFATAATNASPVVQATVGHALGEAVGQAASRGQTALASALAGVVAVSPAIQWAFVQGLASHVVANPGAAGAVATVGTITPAAQSLVGEGLGSAYAALVTQGSAAAAQGVAQVTANADPSGVGQLSSGFSQTAGTAPRQVGGSGGGGIGNSNSNSGGNGTGGGLSRAAVSPN
jgi:hypothetical protein